MTEADDDHVVDDNDGDGGAVGANANATFGAALARPSSPDGGAKEVGQGRDVAGGDNDVVAAVVHVDVVVDVGASRTPDRWSIGAIDGPRHGALLAPVPTTLEALVRTSGSMDGQLEMLRCFNSVHGQDHAQREWRAGDEGRTSWRRNVTIHARSGVWCVNDTGMSLSTPGMTT